MQEIDDLLVGALTPDDEEAVEEELERIIQAEMPEVSQEEPAASEPALPDVPAEPGSQPNYVLVRLLFPVLLFLFIIQKM
jgi:hypothetical protein